MKYLTAAIALVLSTSVHAQVIGKVANPDMSTDDGEYVFVLHDTEAPAGDCSGQKLVKSFYVSHDKTDLLGEGCWVPENDKVLMKLVINGKVEATFPVARKRIKFSEERQG
jgi:hypothetical protein